MSVSLRTGALLATLFLAIAPAASAQKQAVANNCEVCHGMEAREFTESVHARTTVTCTDCHGGNSAAFEIAEAHGGGLNSLATHRDAVEACGACHSNQQAMRSLGLRTDQLSLYFMSAHGRALQADQDADVATCVSCHGSHRVLAPTDPLSPTYPTNVVDTCATCHGDAALMAKHELESSIIDEYSQSVHGRGLLGERHLSNPSCIDCHGSHGATPPRVTEVGQTCGHCHTIALKHFNESPHLTAAENGLMDECTSCHSNHAVTEPSLAMLRGEGEGSCSSCHSGADDPGMIMAKRLADDLGAFDASISETAEAVRVAAEEGLFIDEEHGYLDDARALRRRARPLTHALSPSGIADLLNRGHAMVEQTQESLALKKRSLRDRKIFTGIFAGITVILILVLLTYRRALTSRLVPADDDDDRFADEDEPLE